MKKLLSIIGFSSLLFGVNTNNLQNQYQQYLQNQQQQFASYKQTLNNGFEIYKKLLNEGFKNYKKELSVYWNNPELTTKTTFVEYSKNKKIKTKVDYKNNFIEIQVIENNKFKAQQEMAKRLFNLSMESAQKAFDKNPVLTKVNNQLKTNPKYKKVIVVSKPSNEPIVGDMIFQKPPTLKKVENYAINSVKTHKIEVKKSKVPSMNVYTIKIKLPPKAFLAKAKMYKPEVFKRASQFQLTPEFIYSIIHTESSFNPMARSYIPAFGLMQIVPKSAGADAYKMLTGQKKILTPSYLYNSQNNILIGSAYLKKIYYGYMRKINNPLSRLYCTIAAYNTGAGNVACAFNSTTKDYNGKTECIRSRGDYNIIKASSKINKLTPNEVYNHLLKNLRYDEPKNYLKRVTKRLYIYKKAISSNAL